MLFIFLACLLFFFSIILFSGESLSRPESAFRTLRMLFIMMALATIGFFCLRAGAPLFAGITAAMIAAIPFLQKLYKITRMGFFLHRLFRNTRYTPPPTSAPSSIMTHGEACQILGVSTHATPAEIKRAYVEKMRTNHPDQGGTVDKATAINQARDVLLKKR